MAVKKKKKKLKNCYIPLLAHAAIYYRVFGLNNRRLFLTILEVGKSKIKGQAKSFPGENSLPDLHRTVFFDEYSHPRKISLISFLVRVLIPFWGLYPDDFI